MRWNKKNIVLKGLGRISTSNVEDLIGTAHVCCWGFLGKSHVGKVHMLRQIMSQGQAFWKYIQHFETAILCFRIEKEWPMFCVPSICYQLNGTTAAETTADILLTSQKLWGRADLGGDEGRSRLLRPAGCESATLTWWSALMNTRERDVCGHLCVEACVHDFITCQYQGDWIVLSPNEFKNVCPTAHQWHKLWSTHQP